jgi:predicted metalloendopeptidase
MQKSNKKTNKKPYKKTNKKPYKKTNKANKTKKCPIGLKPFEEKFSKELVVKESTKLGNIETYKKANFAKELLSKFAPSSIKPTNDFYDYINSQWLKNISLEKRQEYIVQIDDFRLAQHKVYKDLDTIIVDYYNNHNNKLAKNLRNYHYSVIQMNPTVYSKKLAQEAIQIVDNYIKNDNPWALLGYFNSDDMLASHVPFVWSLNPDEKNPEIFRCNVNPIRFIILDINVYYDDGTDVAYKQHYRNVYNTFTKEIFDTALGKNNFNPKDIFDVQVDIFNALGCLEVTKKEEMYNRVSKKEAMEKYGFDWEEFSKHLGFKEAPDFFVTSSLNYLKCGSTLFMDNWKTPKWRSYWIYLMLKRLVRITKEWEHLTYNFYGKFEKGQEAINKTDSVSASLYMSVPFNTFLTNEYVRKFENPQAMEYTKILCNDLKIVFKRILERNKWMQPSTKKYALKKLENFTFVYGKPHTLRADPDLSYTKILYDNMIKTIKWRHAKFIELEGKPVIDIPMMDWTMYPVKMAGTQAYIVNASYTPAKNSIYINLGYIQKPFIDLDERGIEYNLAHLGFTIGHEMSHGFDDMGSQYGADGKLFNWWTEKDKKIYKEMQKDVIKQYEEFASRDGIKFDAQISIGEDLADISGMAICDEYLRDFQDNNKDLIPIRALSYNAFYTYFASQEKEMVHKKAISAELKTNPHPLNKYRCNVPLSRSDIFRALYNVKKGDGMWWHNTNTIW